MEDFTNVESVGNESARWIGERVGQACEIEIGVLIATLSDWTEDEMELDDLVTGLIDSGRVQLQIG